MGEVLDSPDHDQSSDTVAMTQSVNAREVKLGLATEWHALMRIAFEKFGVDDALQLEAIERSRGLTSPPPASGALMRSVWGLSSLITEWSRAPEYLDADGQPKILKITGKGASFESLASRFLPGKSIGEVIEMARANAEVELLPRKRIALLGSILVNIANAETTLLAHAIRQIDMLLQTMVHNALMDPTERLASGRMERMVVGVVRKDRFEDLMAELRPQIYDLLLRVDTAVEQRAPVTAEALAESTSVTVGMYVAEEPDWERTGVNPLAVIAGTVEKR